MGDTMYITIDTNILYKGFNVNSMECTALMMLFFYRDELILAVDMCNSEIIKEYRKELNSNEFFQKWYTAISQKQIAFFPGKLSSSIKNELLKRKFHEPPDHVFVAVALNSDKIIITEDSDYGKGEEAKANTPEKQEVLRYMSQDLGLTVMNSKEGLTFLTT